MTISKNDILIVTTDEVAGHQISEVLGLVRGSTVRAKHLGTDIVASLRNLVGGEVREYAALMAGSREQAIDRMAEEAVRLGADAIVAMRVQTSMIQQGASEVLAYGTAVRLG